MEVSVRASGYIQSTYYAQNEDYGFRIHDNLSGSMHDHVLTFKADFDILGVRNSLQKIEVVPATVELVYGSTILNAKANPRELSMGTRQTPEYHEVSEEFHRNGRSR
jgi:Cu2+-containing amine oxidase